MCVGGGGHFSMEYERDFPISWGTSQPVCWPCFPLCTSLQDLCTTKYTPSMCIKQYYPMLSTFMLHAVFLTWYCHKQCTPILTIFISRYYITVTTFRNLNPSPHSSYLAALPYRRIVF